MAVGRRWAVKDRYGNTIYLTDERWEHIIDPWNHPEMRNFEVHIFGIQFDWDNANKNL